VARLPESAGITVPHMGWNTLGLLRPSPLLEGIDPATRFYFVHSYAAPVTADTVATASHGTAFAAVVQRGNFSGVQFHPERSGAAGARLLRNFVTLT
ncbi:MAG: imidazole glycerol phosphate synthase subunit HisH, partial [Opitutales bacterium]